jgi:trimeric autotransporter adhesin
MTTRASQTTLQDQLIRITNKYAFRKFSVQTTLRDRFNTQLACARHARNDEMRDTRKRKCDGRDRRALKWIRGLTLLPAAALIFAGSASAQVLGFGAHTNNLAGGQPGSGVAIGYLANGDSTAPAGSSPVAIGAKADASGAGSQVAIGDHAAANGKNAIAIGGNPFNTKTSASGDYSVSIGTSSSAAGYGAFALGGDANAGASASGNYALALGAQSVAAQDNALAFGTGAQALNANDIALGSGSVTAAAIATQSMSINGVTYAVAGVAPTSTVSVGSVGAERTITNVAAGRVDATSTGAVNGSQLHATNLALAAEDVKVNTLGGSVASAFGGGAVFDASTGAMSAPNYVVYGEPVNNVDNAVAALQNRAPVQYSTANAPTTGLGANGAPVSNDVTLVGPDAAAPVTLHNVEVGVADTDAVNVSQLNAAIGSAVINIGGGGSETWVASNPASLVAPNATGTDALAAGSASAASGTASTAIGTNANASAANSVALGANSVADQANTVSVGSAGNERRVTSVAPGVQSTDAVNVAQLNARSNDLQNLIGDNLKKSYAGSAAAIAIAGLRYDDRPGKISAAAAAGYYHSQMGLAMGVGSTSDNGRWRFNGGLTLTPTLSSPDVGAVVGVSHTFN